MSDTDLKRQVEAVLFAADAPVDLGRLSDIFADASRADVREAVRELNEEYDRDGHSFSIIEIAGGYQMYCRADYQKWVRELHKGRMATRLSQAALETLAIVAYKQPIVRAEIEMIRGVDASGVLATLLKRSLVTIAGRAPGMGRPLMYGTTKEFLRYFGLNAVTDLPRLEEFAEVLGLKPDELDLAVEGAESMSGMEATDDEVAAEDEAVAGNDVDGVAEGAEEYAGGGEDAGETVDDMVSAREAADDPPAASEVPADLEEDKESDEEREPVRALARGVQGHIHGATVTDAARGEDRHHMSDGDLIDSLDED